uniref:Uncharacterized protein n=1 Tax=Angiostrongylus cantonensis TaxID=6313 RepID=A0A0K0DCC0_ANGCA
MTSQFTKLFSFILANVHDPAVPDDAVRLFINISNTLDELSRSAVGLETTTSRRPSAPASLPPTTVVDPLHYRTPRKDPEPNPQRKISG